METANTTMNDKALRREFAELVNACGRCAREAARPWRIATGLLAVALAVVLLAGNAREAQKF